jgi:hypothetical protein
MDFVKTISKLSLGSGRRSGGRSVVPGDKLCAPQQEVPVPLVTHAV